MRKLLYTLLIIIFLGVKLFADRRPFVWTYVYAIGHVGVVEIENYFTYDVKSSNVGFEYQFEFETGICDRWDFSLYSVFKQVPVGDNLRYEMTKFRIRYSLYEKNQFLFDALAYWEYKIFSSLDRYKFEFKFIASKELEWIVFGLNPVYEITLSYYDIPRHELKLVSGLSFSFVDVLFLGAESEFKYEVKGGNYSSSFWVGPTLSVGNSSIWLNVGTLFNTLDDFKIRFLLGLYL